MGPSPGCLLLLAGVGRVEELCEGSLLLSGFPFDLLADDVGLGAEFEVAGHGLHLGLDAASDDVGDRGFSELGTMVSLACRSSSRRMASVFMTLPLRIRPAGVAWLRVLAGHLLGAEEPLNPGGFKGAAPGGRGDRFNGPVLRNH